MLDMMVVTHALSPSSSSCHRPGPEDVGTRRHGRLCRAIALFTSNGMEASIGTDGLCPRRTRRSAEHARDFRDCLRERRVSAARVRNALRLRQRTIPI